MKVFYDSVYLIGVNSARHSKHRVTEREGKKRPGTVQFSGQYLLPDGVTPYGTLVLTEELWEEWFAGRTMLSHMKTVVGAAEYMVKQDASISYGCPLCAAQFSTYVKAQEHITKHVKKFLTQFRVEEEYICPICGKVYVRAGCLKTHLEKYIAEKIEEGKNED